MPRQRHRPSLQHRQKHMHGHTRERNRKRTHGHKPKYNHRCIYRHKHRNKYCDLVSWLICDPPDENLRDTVSWLICDPRDKKLRVTIMFSFGVDDGITDAHPLLERIPPISA